MLKVKELIFAIAIRALLGGFFTTQCFCSALEPSQQIASHGRIADRRAFLLTAPVVSTLYGAPLARAAEPSSGGLASRMAKRDPNELKNKLFNIPPGVQVYPEWMRGTWNIQSRFSGYLFPSTKIPKQALLQDFTVPGFQKCSIAQTSDVGKDLVQYTMKIDETTGWEDRNFNLAQSINGYLGYSAVASVVYNGSKNANRIGIDFVDYRTVNAERIELFCNARESESYSIPVNDSERSIFVASEHIKQVTFGTGSTAGVPRQVGTNYGLFWTWKQGDSNDVTSSKTMQGNLLVAAYLDPQDSLYFQEPSAPVVVYSHQLSAQRTNT